MLPMLVSVRSQSHCSLVSNVHFQYSSHIIHLMLPGPEQMRSLQSISFQLKWITKWYECSFNNCFGRRPWKCWLCGGKKTLLKVRIGLMFPQLDLSIEQIHQWIHKFICFTEFVFPWCVDQGLSVKCRICIHFYKDAGVKITILGSDIILTSL